MEECNIQEAFEGLCNASGETLLVVEFPMVQDNLVIGGQMHIVHAYGKWEVGRHGVAVGDIVTYAFPEQNTQNKGFVV